MWHSNAFKLIRHRNHNIIQLTRTVNHQDISYSISTPNNSYMVVIGIKHQITRLCLFPRNIETLLMLAFRTATLADYILAI